MNKLNKIAEQIKESQLFKETWIDLLSKLRYLYLFYQTAHWISKGKNYYGDHLLFERLYDEMGDEIDGVAERAIGTTNEDCVNLKESISSFVTLDQSVEPYKSNMVQASIMLNQSLIDTLEEIDLGEHHTSGTRDMLNAISSLHETHLYLLKQRAKELK